METYDSEQEQVEALKKWWKENGRSVIAGLVIGVGGMVGWKSWTTYQESQAENASIAYDQLVQIVDRGQVTEALPQGERLINEYSRSTYAALSSLILAKVAMNAGSAEDAGRHLQWVVDHANFPELKHLATLRLAQLLLQAGEADQALGLLTDQAPPGFEAVHQETRGDILVAKGDRLAARTAYRRALASSPSTSTNRRLLQMKLDDLGPAPESQLTSAKEAG